MPRRSGPSHRSSPPRFATPSPRWISVASTARSSSNRTVRSRCRKRSSRSRKARSWRSLRKISSVSRATRCPPGRSGERRLDAVEQRRPSRGLGGARRATLRPDPRQRDPARVPLRPDGPRDGPRLGRPQHRQPRPRRAHHAGRIRRLLSLYEGRHRSLRCAADRDGVALPLPLPPPALPPAPHRPLGAAQHPAHHLRSRRRLRLSRAAALQRRLPHHQPSVRGQQHRRRRRDDSLRAARRLPRRHLPRRHPLPLPRSHANGARHPRHRAEPHRRPSLRREPAPHLRAHLRDRRGARRCGGRAVRRRFADHSLHRSHAHREVVRHRHPRRARQTDRGHPRRALARHRRGDDRALSRSDLHRHHQFRAARSGPRREACTDPGACMKNLQRAGLALLAVGLAAVPFVASDTLVQFGINALLVATLTQGWNIIGGFTGYPSFGNSVFYGLGTYGTAIAMAQLHLPFGVGLVAGGVLGVAFALLFGIPILRLRGPYFAIATLGLAAVMSAIVATIGFAGKNIGLILPLFRGDTLFYELSLVLLVAATGTVAWLARSRFGAGLVAIREDEDAAQVMGINTTMYKVGALALAAFFSSLAGGIHAYWITFIDPGSAFDPTLNVRMVIMTLFGGPGTIFGPVLGSFVLSAVSEVLASKVSTVASLFYGFVIVLAVVFMPNGRLGIGRTFQVMKPFPGLSVLENVTVGALFGATEGQEKKRAKARELARELLEFTGLTRHAEQRADQLGGPDRKRLEFAKALALHPKLLLLDEVMAGLNHVEVDEVVALIRKIRHRKVTILVIEHVMKAIRNLSDRLLVIHHGQQIAQGKVDEVLADQRVVEAYLGKRRQ